MSALDGFRAKGGRGVCRRGRVALGWCLPVERGKVAPLQSQQRGVRIAAKAKQTADGRLSLEPCLEAKAQHGLIEVVAKVPQQGGHQAEVTPAVERLKRGLGDIELHWPACLVRACQGLFQQPHLVPLVAGRPALLTQEGGEARGIRVLAEDVEIAAGPVEPDGDSAHQRQVLAQAPQRIPAACVEQGMGGALAGIALGQIVEAAPVGRGGLRRWKNCGRGRSYISAQKATITQQGSPW